MEILNPLTLPFKDTRLIEASAGTGKTYTLVLLYLRLLLQLGGNAAFIRRLNVTEILVVTFTEAATQELRDRVRESIHQMHIACLRQQSEQQQFQQLLDEIPNLTQAAEILELAERQMDEAAIYTIHGFCQRILAANAFEVGLPFQQLLIQDESQIREEAVKDFWRKYFYALPALLIKNILLLWREPDQLLNEISPYLNGELSDVVIPYASQNATEFIGSLVEIHQKNITNIDYIKKLWLTHCHEIENIIALSGINKKSYSKRNTPLWIDKVTQWSQQLTETYYYPAELQRFSQAELAEKTLKETMPNHQLFEKIDAFLSQSFDLKKIIMFFSIIEVKRLIEDKKQKKSQLGFDDLLVKLKQAVAHPSYGNALTASIAKNYPIAMVDEFQDTDPIQYGIFEHIYANRKECALLFIGDPKQAIYGFRGADVFTYIHAKSRIKQHYTMNINWRSSAAVVEAVNQLFNHISDPFIFPQIPFIQVTTPPTHQQYKFIIDETLQPAMQCCLLPEEVLNTTQYHQRMANFCSERIQSWLTASQKNKAWFEKKGQRYPVTSADIAILVRTRREAQYIKDALLKRGIQSVYLSNRNTVFDSFEAQELVWLLQAILVPEKGEYLRTALACHLLGYTFKDIDEINQNEDRWDALVEQFISYQQYWFKKGFLPMLRALMRDYHIAENLLLAEHGERALTDLMHLGELLQEASYRLDSEHALLRWLIQQIEKKNVATDDQQQRLESDKNLIKIITLHKSKGLEYPIVWLPFICNFRESTQAIYHERDSFKPVLDLSAEKDISSLADEERLAEDLRLLYVGLTRAIYHCCLGIGAISAKNNTKNKTNSEAKSDTILHRSALGYLVQQKKAADYQSFKNQLATMLHIDSYLIPETVPITLFTAAKPDVMTLQAKHFTRHIYDDWNISSYSSLQRHAVPFNEMLPYTEVEITQAPTAIFQTEMLQTETMIPSVYTFPKGARVGTLLHELMESFDFSAPIIDKAIFMPLLQQLNLDDRWASFLFQWVTDIISTPLNEQGLTLQSLPDAQRLLELQFYLPIRHLLTAEKLNQLNKRYDPLSARCDDLDFKQIRGMLKGFIDLVFVWQGRYYLLDYKSNWLGDQPQYYDHPALIQAMCDHRYDLQYQLYTLALHRFLKHRLPHYDYDADIGGVYYLFLRGMNGKTDTGVFYHKPEKTFIEQLDHLLG